MLTLVQCLRRERGQCPGGLVASYDMMIVDAEMLQMMSKFLQPIVVNDDTLALDAIAEVGPGGHF
ncbi:MAG: trimethylamine methyltransferase family protein, partial [Dongiaceae bacterium]